MCSTVKFTCWNEVFYSGTMCSTMELHVSQWNYVLYNETTCSAVEWHVLRWSGVFYGGTACSAVFHGSTVERRVPRGTTCSTMKQHVPARNDVFHNGTTCSTMKRCVFRGALRLSLQVGHRSEVLCGRLSGCTSHHTLFIQHPATEGKIL